MSWLWWAVPLVLLVFFWTTNDFLRGSQKEIIGGLLAMMIFGLVASAFIVSGWKIGLVAFFGSFLLSNLLRPVAFALAKAVIPYPDLGFDDYARRELEKTKAEFGSEAADKSLQAEKRHKLGTIAKARRNLAIAATLRNRGAAEQDLESLYDRIEVKSLPPKYREVVLTNPALVAFYLDNSSPSRLYDGRYARDLDYETHLALQLWTHNNPGGDMPEF